MPRISPLIAVSLLCPFLGAQNGKPVSIPAQVRERIEKQVRQYAEAPPEAQVTIGAAAPSEFGSFYDLPVVIHSARGEQTYRFLLARDFKQLIYPRTFDLTQDPFAHARQTIVTEGRPMRGSPDAPVTIVMYDDLQCPFCAQQYISLFNEVMNHYRSGVKVVMKDFPLTDIHPWAMDAAVTADCLAQQSETAYWNFADYLHTHQQAATARWNQDHAGAFVQIAAEQVRNADVPALKGCVAQGRPKAAIEASLAEGRSLNVTATPALFINGEFFDGVLTPEQLRLAIDRALKEAKQPHE
ncbi:MAG: DsbA family protein [Acidobacteria bacterium]|nr:DsbA family protein [Acidobacteriota bacterium]